MDAIVLFSHGSVLCGAARPLAEHAERLRCAGVAPIVEVGFLNYTRPAFAGAVDRCVSAGATRVVVVPFFLAPGRFVTTDLPPFVEAARRDHPALEFVVAEPLGYAPALAEAVLDLASRALPVRDARDLLPRDPATCNADPDCPLYGTTDCPRAAASRPPIAKENGPAQARHAERSEAFPPPAGMRGPGLRMRAAPTIQPAAPVTGGRGAPSALLILAHGSPRETANDPFERVVAEARGRGAYAVVQVGYLERNRPSIPEAIDACFAKGAKTVATVPFFLHLGRHVVRDVPALLIDGEARHPGLRAMLAGHIGASPRVTELLAQRAAEALAR